MTFVKNLKYFYFSLILQNFKFTKIFIFIIFALIIFIFSVVSECTFQFPKQNHLLYNLLPLI